MQAFRPLLLPPQALFETDSGPLMCPGWRQASCSPAPCHAAWRKAGCHLCALPNSTGKPLGVKLLWPWQNNSSAGVWFSSSLFYFVETGWYFIALQRCPEVMYIMFFKQNFILRYFFILLEWDLGLCLPLSPR